MYQTMNRTTIFVILVAVFFTGCGTRIEPSVYSRTEPVMGTFVQVKVTSFEYSRGELEEKVGSAIEKARYLEKKFSIFDSSSEVNKLNFAGKKEVSEELFFLIEEALNISALTVGEFDITVSPILKSDGFYEDMPVAVRDSIPDDLDGVSWTNVRLDPGKLEVELEKGAWIDLSGIAKGYIVDRMAECLKEEGIDQFLVNAGGDMRCGNTGGGNGWKIGIRRPASEQIIMVLALENMAVATSGDYENVVIDNDSGERIAHIIDPETDEAKKERPSSITVISSTCIRADALATGMMAMGEKKALELAENMENVEIIAVECYKDECAVIRSVGAEKYVLER